MPKRKLDEELEQDWTVPQTSEAKVGVKKNSLDSDEDESDEDDKAYKILACDDIEGQEEGTAQMEGNVRITPFNMKEELEEGHFDADGHYHFKKGSRDDIKDNWLDNIDWVKIKKTEGDGDKPSEDKKSDDSSSSSSDDEEMSSFDQISVYSKILEYLKPGETVAKALRRLGGGASLSASQKLKLKKQGLSAETGGDKEAMLALTELANGLLNATGNMNVYQETFEQITRTIAAKSKPAAAAKEEEVLDMYADDFDVKEKARLITEPKPEDSAAAKPEDETSKSKEEPSTSADLAGVDEVNWEFKWSDDSEEIHGPHTSSQMQAWVNEGYFKDTVCVRKVGKDSNFYSCRRVDFELYI